MGKIDQKQAYPRWAYALRTELGDGAGEEAIKDTINHLVANLTSEQWARDR